MLPDDVRLQHMLDAAEKAVAFTHGKSRTDVESNELLMLALVQADRQHPGPADS